MPHIGKTEIVVLWEHEIIKAAQMLEKIIKTKEHKPSSKDYLNAIKACYAAIYSPELASGKCPVTVMNAKITIGDIDDEIRS